MIIIIIMLHGQSSKKYIYFFFTYLEKMQYENKQTKNVFIKMNRFPFEQVQAEAPPLQADTCQPAVNHQTCINEPVKSEGAHSIIIMIVIILHYLWPCC